MADISSGIAGSFNQAAQASRLAESEKARTRRTEDDRIREARKRFAVAQEEVSQTETLRGSRVDPDKEETSGRDARDQYEAHDEFLEHRRQVTPARTPPRQKTAPQEPGVGSGDSGQLIDLEA
jgi:hypothetical protein